MSARPPAWRTGLLILALLVFLGICGLLSWKGVSAPFRTPPPPTCIYQTMTGSLNVADVTIHLYNGAGKDGLGRQTGDELEELGFMVPEVATGYATVQTTIKGGAADDPEVLLVAAFFPDGMIVADERDNHVVSVILGTTYAGLNHQAPMSIPVTEAIMCKSTYTPTPATPTTTPTPTPTPTG